MKVFVTGCTGFIGLHLCRALFQRGHDVVGLVRTPSKIPADLKDKLTVVPGDLSVFTDPSFVMPEVDVVIHLAAVIAGKNDQEYATINYNAVEDMLACLQRQDWQPKRFVFASSLAAAGPSPESRALTEADEPKPIDPYGGAKKKAESLMREQPFATTSFRPPIVLGPGDAAFFTLFKMVKSGLVVVPSGQPQRLSFVYVHDLVQAICILVEDTSEKHRLYYTTHEQVVTNEQLLLAIAEAMNKKVRVLRLPRWVLWLAMKFMTGVSKVLPIRNQLDHKQYKQMTAPAFVCTSQKLTEEMGWKAETDLPELMEQTVRGYQDLGWL